MFIDENVFNDQMRGLLVARGGYTSEKKKEEIKRYWYLEFRNCDERGFIVAMGRLKFAGTSGDGFPSFKDFREEYNQIIKPEDRLKGREYCGLCREGRVFYRAVHEKTGEVLDYVADCARCHAKDRGEFTKVNPHSLHKDRAGRLRTFEALAIDRVPQEVKWPPFVRILMEKKERRPEYFTGLHPIDDPDFEYEFKAPPMNDGKDIAQALLRGESPKKAAKREMSLKKDRKQEEFGNVPY